MRRKERAGLPGGADRPEEASASEEIKRKQEALRESESRYRALFETTLDGIMVVDETGQYIDLNESMCRIMKAPRSQLIGRHFSEFMLPEALERAKQAFHDLKSKGFYRGEFPIRAVDGSRVDLEWSSRADFLPGLHFCVARDMSERKRAEEERQKRETLLDIALEAGRMGVFDFHLRSGKVIWSPHLERIHSLDPGAFGGTFEDFKRDIHPDDLERVLARIQQAMREKRVDYSVEYRIIKPSGEQAWVEARGRVFYDPNGEAERFVGLCMDVTARKQTEEKLKGESAFRRAIEEAIPAGMAMADPNGQQIYVNPAFCEMVEWSDAELVGAMPPYRYWPPEEMDRIAQAFEATLAGKVPPNGFELRFRRRNGARFDVLVTSVPLKGGRGELIGWLASVVDITKRKQMERKLQEGETQYRLLFETNPQPMWVYEIESMAFLEVNQAAIRHYGYSREEFLSMTIKEIRPPEEVPRVVQSNAEVSEEVAMGLHFAGAWRHRKKDGTLIDVEITRSPLLFEGKKALLILANDITERRRAEAERVALLAREQQARQEAEMANRAKDDFLATVSHELRTPLNAIYGWARLLQMGDFDRETVVSAYETIERNSKAQSQLIDDLLDVSRIIAGKLRLDIRSIELRPVIEAAIETVQPAADAKEITLQSVFDEKIGLFSGDPDRLQQIVWNLLSNAIKFTSNGGRVEVRLERIGDAVQIRVGDTGIGITPEFLPYVFDRFRQAEKTSTRLHGGLGLGLAIVRHLAELHGGSVSADSPGEGEGATFIVTLPLKTASISPLDPERTSPAVLEAAAPLSPSSILSGIEILLVDDEADARTLLTLILQKAGARVTTVSSVREAIGRLKQQKPDLLVSDIEMPAEDGYALIRRVRAQEAERGERALPAVALTAYAARADRRRALMAGYQKHVPKPVDPSGLVAVIAGLLGRPREIFGIADRSSDEAASR